MSLSMKSEHHEEQQILSGGLPVATMSGTSSEVVPGTFYRHQSAFRTEKADSLGRDSRVEGVSRENSSYLAYICIEKANF